MIKKITFMLRHSKHSVSAFQQPARFNYHAPGNAGQDSKSLP